MGILSDLTLEQLRSATLAQIRTAISNKLANLTKLQLIRLILRVGVVDIDSVLEIPDQGQSEDGPHGQLWRLQVFRGVLGNKLRSEKTEWTYYPEGPVNEITTIQLDATDTETSRKVIKHYLDGRQSKVVG